MYIFLRRKQIMVAIIAVNYWSLPISKSHAKSLSYRIRHLNLNLHAFFLYFSWCLNLNLHIFSLL